MHTSSSLRPAHMLLEALMVLAGFPSRIGTCTWPAQSQSAARTDRTAGCWPRRVRGLRGFLV
eukprot:2704861-Amphidinium_carterae.1